MTAESHIVLQLMKMVGDIFLTMQTYQEIHSLKFLIIKLADLISKDMVFHTIKSDEVEEFFK
jgi:hypothetical protein